MNGLCGTSFIKLLLGTIEESMSTNDASRKADMWRTMAVVHKRTFTPYLIVPNPVKVMCLISGVVTYTIRLLTM